MSSSKLLLQRLEVATLRPASPVEDRKGKHVLVKPKKTPGAEKWRWCLEDIPSLREGKASLRATVVSVGGGEAKGITGESMRMASEVDGFARGTLEALREYTGVTDEASEMVKVG